MLRCLVHGKNAISDRATRRRDRDASTAGQVLACDGVRVIQQVGNRATHHNVSPVLTGAWPNIDHPVGHANRVFIVFDDDKRVAEISKAHECVDQAAVIALVQADARLI